MQKNAGEQNVKLTNEGLLLGLDARLTTICRQTRNCGHILWGTSEWHRNKCEACSKLWSMETGGGKKIRSWAHCIASCLILILFLRMEFWWINRFDNIKWWHKFARHKLYKSPVPFGRKCLVQRTLCSMTNTSPCANIKPFIFQRVAGPGQDVDGNGELFCHTLTPANNPIKEGPGFGLATFFHPKPQ